MKIPKELFFLGICLLTVTSSARAENEETDLDDVGFDDEEDSEDNISSSSNFGDDFFKKQEMEIRSSILSAVKLPEKQTQLSQVLPIIRSMSTPQKRAMAILVSSRRSNNDTTLPYEKVEAIFGADHDKNITKELMLPISMDIAKIISDDISEDLPEAQGLRYVPPGNWRRPIYNRIPSRRPLSMNRRNVHPDGPRPNIFRPGRRPTEVKRKPTEEDCTFFSTTVCLEAMDYPHEAIMRSIRNNRDMIAALLTDFKGQNPSEFQDEYLVTSPQENKYENRFESNEIKRRSDIGSLLDDVEEGYTCPSQVKYARPQLARAASGVWKYIINTGEHTQTLRLEKCSKPQTSCSFVSENYRSTCTQVFNYHRLLTWDSNLGLHMDIFKIPTCCSCHVHGYSDIFPPHRKNPPEKSTEKFPGADFVTEDESNNFNYQKPSIFGSKKSPSANFGPGYLSDGPSSTYLEEDPEDSSYQYFDKKPFVESTPARPSFTSTSRPRVKKQPGKIFRPFENLPPQHAPNTRAPGYTGPKIRSRPSRPFRRESNSQLDNPSNTENESANKKRYSQPIDQEVDATTRVQTGTLKEDYQEPHRRVNYNYHPIIDFFEPEASKLQSVRPQVATQASTVQSSNAWKPMISP